MTPARGPVNVLPQVTAVEPGLPAVTDGVVVAAIKEDVLGVVVGSGSFARVFVVTHGVDTGVTRANNPVDLSGAGGNGGDESGSSGDLIESGKVV